MAATVKIDNRIKINYELKNRTEIDTLISITFTFLGKRYKVSLGEKVPPQYWDAEANRAVITSNQTQAQQRQLKRLNRFLTNFEDSLKTIVVGDSEDAQSRYPKFIADLVKARVDALHGKEKKEEERRALTPLEYFAKVVDDMPKKVIKRTGKFIEDKTVNHHKIVLKRVASFFDDAHLRNANFSIFDKYFEGRMEQWMLKKEYSPNTVATTFSVMKVWLNQAEEEGLLTNKSFHTWKSKGFDVQHIYLTEDELMAIYALPFTDEFNAAHKIDPKSCIEQTRDIFIIASQIGLRYGDMGSLNRSNWDIDNRTVEVHTHKTGETVKVPLTTVVIEIYNKYGGNFPQPIDRGKFNMQLTRICEFAGLTDTVYVKSTSGGKRTIVGKRKCDMVSSHTARRSFATNLYKRCKNPRMVMAFTGHKTEENFRKYICIDKEEMVDMAKEFFN